MTPLSPSLYLLSLRIWYTHATDPGQAFRQSHWLGTIICMFQSKITAAFSKPKAKSGLEVQRKEMWVWGSDRVLVFFYSLLL